MSGREATRDDVLDLDEVRDVLRATFYNPNATREAPSPDPRTPADGRPTHYKTICISMYTESLQRLDAVVEELKRRGFTRANRSSVLRAALEQFDPSRVRRGL